MSSVSIGVFGVFSGENTAQGVGEGFGDNDIAEATDEGWVGAREVDDTVVFGAALQLSRVFFRVTGHEHTLCAINHIGGNRFGLLADPVLEDGQAMFFCGFRRVVGEARRRGARTSAVDEAEGEIEADFFDKRHCGGKCTFITTHIYG